MGCLITFRNFYCVAWLFPFLFRKEYWLHWHAFGPVLPPWSSWHLLRLHLKIYVVDLLLSHLFWRWLDSGCASMGQMEHRPKSKRINPDPLAKRHNRLRLNQMKQLIIGTQPRKINRLNQATQYLWWRSNSFDCLLCPFPLFFWWGTFFIKPLYVDLTWASMDILFQFPSLLLLLLLLDIFDPLQTKWHS